jgi:2-phosphosulfolactate phosphatase
MKIIRKSLLQGAKEVSGFVVVIDVFRAFSCEPLFFHLGAKRVILEADPIKAIEMKNQNPSYVLVGEQNEVPLEGADAGNSPSQILKMGHQVFKDRVVIHRTTAGVTGVNEALKGAQKVLLGSFLMARAISGYLKEIAPPLVTLLSMGERGLRPSPEDEACADYIESLLTEKNYNHLEALEEIIFSNSAQKFLRRQKPYLPPEDPVICLQKDLFPMVLEATKVDGQIQVIRLQ